MLGVLLKLKVTESLSVFKKGKKNFDYVGTLLGLALAAVTVYIIVTVFSQFVQKYVEIRINGSYQPWVRQAEITAFVFEFVFIAGVISSIGQINRSLYESDDREILSTLPVDASTVFYSKLLVVYLKQAVQSLIIILPLSITFGLITAQTAYFYIMSALACFALPAFAIFTASVLCLPVHYVKTFLRNRYILTFVLGTGLLGVFFWAYSKLLNGIQILMTTGEIKFFFAEDTMNKISALSKNLFPANLLSNIVMHNKAGLNIVIFIAAMLACAAAGFFIVRALYAMPAAKIGGGNLFTLSARLQLKRRPVAVTLLMKEFEQVLRTPAYAMQYLSIAVVMPLMVYACMKLGRDLMQTMVFMQKNLELSLFLVAMFGTLTNTFCATNISRDGKVFATMKTLPLHSSEILGAKIMFSFIISLIAVAACAIVLTTTGFISGVQALFVFAVGAVLGAAQIMFATRKDLNNPSFKNSQENAVTESAGTVSVILFLGLAVSAVVGGVPLAAAIKHGLTDAGGQYFTYLFAGVFSLTVAIGAAAYYFIGLDKAVKRLTENGR